MRTLGIWLGTVLAVTCMLSQAVGGPAVVKKTPSVLHLQENDEFTVRIRQDSAEQAVTVKESLGVGKDAPAGKAETFDITVIDSTPTGDKWLSSRSTPWQVQTIRGKQFAIPWRAAAANGVRAIRFPLKGVPYLAPGDQSCCGCGDEGSCGRGCAVEWSYEIEPSRTPADRGDVSYTVSPATLVAGQDNEVTVTSTAASSRSSGRDVHSSNGGSHSRRSNCRGAPPNSRAETTTLVSSTTLISASRALREPARSPPPVKAPVRPPAGLPG